MTYVKIISTFLRALAAPYTYDIRHNAYLWFGIAWGLPVPVFSLALDATLVGAGRSIPQMFQQHPIHLVFALHPLLFGTIFGALGTIRRDLEKEKADLIARLQDMALTDPLTGVSNRRFVLDELDSAVHRAERTGEPVSVILFDLDNFKEINDRQGHLAGDKILKEVAHALRDILRRGDRLGRYGGDEFLAVVAGGRDDAQMLAARARGAVQDRARIGVSAGIGTYPKEGDSPATLIAAADRELAHLKQERYRAKPETRRMLP